MRLRLTLLVASVACGLLLAAEGGAGGAPPPLAADHVTSPQVAVALELQARGEMARDASVRIQLHDALDGSRPPVVRRIPVPGATELQLPQGSQWIVSSVDGCCWTAPRSLTVGSTPVHLQLEVRAAAEIAGSLQTSRQEALPDSLTLTLLPRKEERSPAARDQAQVHCPVRGSRWRCRVPAGLIDLRLRARGFLSEYRWGVRAVTGGVLDLGVLQLRRGASVTGWVETDDAQPIDRSCRIELDLPAMAPERSGVDTRASLRKLTTTPLDNGFFDFEGVAPGRYAISVSQHDYALATLYPILVEENTETALEEPILLERPARLTVTVDPPQDFEGRSWAVSARDSSPIDNQPKERQLVEVTAGTFRSENLKPGEYLVAVRDASKQLMTVERFALSSHADSLDVRIPLLDLKGTIRLGDQPLGDATIALQADDDTSYLKSRSDQFGYFGGALPAGHHWKAHVWATLPHVDTTLETLDVVETESDATVSIILPANTLRGRVIDERGRGVSAAVEYFNLGRGGHSSLRTDAEGGFLLNGLPSGEFTFSATAETTGATSAAVSVLLADTGSTEVTLTVRDRQSLSGFVVGSAGPVARALVMAFPVTTAGPQNILDVPDVTTGADGAFALDLPAAAAAVRLVIMARGRVLDVASVQLPQRDPVVLHVAEATGTILLRWKEPLNLDDPRLMKPTLTVKGLDLDMAVLRVWALRNGVPVQSPATEISLPYLAAGAYRACFPARGETLAGFMAGRRGACVDGVLTAMSDFVLSAP